MKEEISNNLNKHVKELKIKAEKENVLAQKRHKAEVKSWKEDLGEERKMKINLEKKLEIIMKRKEDDEVQQRQKRKEGGKTSEILNSECNDCDNTFEDENSGPIPTVCEHEHQCVLRQPYPPPSPSSPFIVHEVSKYHIHMMTKTTEDLTGCIRCFSIDNENYGCDKCTWLKWWFKWHGDRHGFPDIHPSVYRKHL